MQVYLLNLLKARCAEEIGLKNINNFVICQNKYTNYKMMNKMKQL